MIKQGAANDMHTVGRTVPISRIQRLLRDIVKYRYVYILLAPTIIFYIIFAYKPMYGLTVAFKDFSIFKGIQGSPWVGLENFKNFFQNPYFGRLMHNGIMINVYSIIFGFPVPIILALMFNEVRNTHFRKIAQTLTYLPHFISVVIVCGIVITFLSPSYGLVNSIISAFGGEKVYFLSRPEWFRTIYISMGIWKEAGFGTIVYFAALSGINSELYDACKIDGGGRWRQTVHVTIPGILSTVVIILILRLGSMIDAGYESIILLYQPTTYETADVLSSYISRAGIENAQFSVGAVAGMFNSVVSLILVAGANLVSKKVSEISLW